MPTSEKPYRLPKVPRRCATAATAGSIGAARPTLLYRTSTFQSLGGTLDPNEQGSTNGNAYVNVQWVDTWSVGAAPAGSPVLLLVNPSFDAIYQNLLGDISPTTLIYDFTLGSLSAVTPCSNGLPTAVGDSNVYSPVAGMIESSPAYAICVPSGSSLQLNEDLTAQVYGYGMWNATIDVIDTATTYVTVLTPGATLTSASGLTYASAVPEASSVFLTAGGLIVLVAYSRAKRMRTHR